MLIRGESEIVTDLPTPDNLGAVTPQIVKCMIVGTFLTETMQCFNNSDTTTPVRWMGMDIFGQGEV